MNPELRDLAKQYARALQEYVAGRGEAALQEACDLGRQALGDGVGVHDMAAIQHRALLRSLMRVRTREESSSTLRAASRFIVESLLPFEMSHRRSQEVNAALRESEERYRSVVDTARDIIFTLSPDGRILSMNPAFETVTGWSRTEWIGKDFLPLVHPDDRPRAAQIYQAVLKGPAARRLEDVRGLLDKIEEQLRHLSHELRPTILDDLGLGPALEFLADGVSKRTGLAITVEGSPGKRLPAPAETALYRIVQEALTNVTKHAQATRAYIKFMRNRRF